MDTSKFKGRIVDGRKSANHEITTDEATSFFNQGMKIYEFLKQRFKEDYVDFAATPVKTKEDLMKLGVEFLKNVAKILDDAMPVFYQNFLKPVMKNLDTENMVYTYICNLYISPMVMKIVDEYYDTYLAVKN